MRCHLEVVVVVIVVIVEVVVVVIVEVVVVVVVVVFDALTTLALEKKYHRDKNIYFSSSVVFKSSCYESLA